MAGSAAAAGHLRALISAGGLSIAPGCSDGLGARLIEQAGFSMIYASGGAIARGSGVPDLGLLSMTEMATRMAEIVRATSLPVIADADTGYGNALNAMRTARAFSRSGVAAIHLEDQTFPKRCGHYDDKAVVPVAEMAGKIVAAREAVGDELVLIARTDAIAVEGFDAAIDRCHAYAEAGAEVIFLEAPTSAEQIEEAAVRLPYPKLLNMFRGGKTPPVSRERLAALGYAIVIVPSDLQRAAIHAMQSALGALVRDGTTDAMAERMVSFSDREEIVGTPTLLATAERFADR